MLIVRDDISNDVITPNWRWCFSMVVYIHAYFHFALIGGNLTAQSTATGELGVEFKLQALLPFPALPPVHLESLVSGYCYRV